MVEPATGTGSFECCGGCCVEGGGGEAQPHGSKASLLWVDVGEKV